MPPVFGPRSPSKTALWSCAAGIATTVLPSVKARNDASSPYEELLHDHPAARGAEGALLHDVVDGGLGLLERPADDDPLAGGQAVGLDHERRPGLADVGARRAGVGEGARGRGRDAVAAHELLGKALAALELGGGAAGAEDPQAVLREEVDDAGAERRLGTDDREADRLSLAKASSPRRSLAAIGTQLATAPIPPFPGAQNTSRTRGLWRSFQASACSRPPLPTTRIRMPVSVSRP